MTERTVPSKIEVNAAIEALIAMSEGDDWTPCAATIIAYAKSIPESSHISLEHTSASSSDGDSFVGHTAEVGDVAIKDTDEQKSRSFALGIHRDRVGYYKLMRYEGKNGGMIRIQGFWKSDIATSVDGDDKPAMYYLRYGLDSRPEYFGKTGERIIICFVLFGTRYKLTRGFVSVSVPNKGERKNGIGISIRSV